MKRIHLLLLILFTLIAYANILLNGFAWDDKDFFIDWPQIKNEEGLPAYLSLPYLLTGDLPLNHRGVYRPVRSIYYLASYALWGQNPLGYHIQAIVVHILIVLIIYLITGIITKKRALAFITATLFALHPIHTEAVTFTTASMDTLGILFFFLSFYLYLRRSIFASVLYGLFAFFTYEMTLVLPLIILLYDFCINNFSFKKLIPKINIYKFFFLSLLAYFLIRFIVLGIGNRADYLGITWQIVSNDARVGMPEIFKNYLSWLIWPVHLMPRREIPTNVLLSYLLFLHKIDPSDKLIDLSTHFVFLFPIIYAFLGLSLIYIFFKKYPIIAFGFAWMIISLLPASNIIPQGAVVAERFLYIPSFGFTLILGILFYYGFYFFQKTGKYKFISYLLLLIIPITAIFYSYQTIKRNADWRDEKTIWRALMREDPKNSVPYDALGQIYAKEGQYDQAISVYKKGLEINPQSPNLNSDLGLAFGLKGETDKAITQLKLALKADSSFYMSHVYLGNIYLKQKKYDIAKEEYNTALRIKGQNDPVILGLLDKLKTLEDQGK